MNEIIVEKIGNAEIRIAKIGTAEIKPGILMLRASAGDSLHSLPYNLNMVGVCHRPPSRRTSEKYIESTREVQTRSRMSGGLGAGHTFRSAGDAAVSASTVRHAAAQNSATL